MQYQAPQHEIRKRPIRITLVISRCPHQIISIPSPRNLTTTATMKQYQMGSNNMKLWKTAGEVTYRSWLMLSNSFLFCGLHWMRNEAVSTNCPTVALKPDRKALNGCFNPGAKRQPKVCSPHGSYTPSSIVPPFFSSPYLREESPKIQTQQR